MPKKLSDGTEHAAHVLFTELVKCEREGDIYYAGGRSRNYERCGAMTREYVEALVAGLTELMAAHDAERGKSPPAVDDIKLTRGPGKSVRFELFAGGKLLGAGAVTEGVARKAKAFLDGLFDPGNVVKFKKRASELILALCLLEPFAVLMAQ